MPNQPRHGLDSQTLNHKTLINSAIGDRHELFCEKMECCRVGSIDEVRNKLDHRQYFGTTT